MQEVTFKEEKRTEQTSFETGLTVNKQNLYGEA